MSTYERLHGASNSAPRWGARDFGRALDALLSRWIGRLVGEPRWDRLDSEISLGEWRETTPARSLR